jgi:choline-sulfatase
VKKILDFVDSQPWGKRTAVVISSDHGETFGEHKMYKHGFELWSVLTHVPLMIRVPGVAPRKIDEPRGMVDMTATVLELLGTKADASFQGKSLVPELVGATPEARDVVTDLARTSDNDRKRTLRRGKWKIIEHGNADAFQLFDLEADPDEKTDLARKEPAKLEELRSALRDANSKIREICPKNTQKLKGKKSGKPC